MLKIKNLTVQVENKPILQNINMQFEIGKNYCILWKNGSWKSSLALTLMGHPKFKIKEGEIQYEKIILNDLKANERSKLWIFLAFQNIPEIKGIKLFEFLRSIYSEKTGENTTFIKFKNIILPYLEELWIDKEFLRRDLNVWFSGGEKRKLEILQIKLLKPKFIILDEVDSGLDIDAFKSVAKLLQKENNSDNTFIVITHLFEILDRITLDEVYVLEKWKIKTSWWKNIIKKIKTDWFENL